MAIEIKHHYEHNTLFVSHTNNMHEAVQEAVTDRANLAGADLAGVDLVRADLTKANMAGAKLARTNLVGANLVGANLVGANLAGANLVGANLALADLAGAYLSGANLVRANLAGAKLAGAYLSGAYLSGANLAGDYLIGAYIDGEQISIAPISFTGLTWPILITASYMRIGCERHMHEEWETFSKEDIKKMHAKAAEFWEVWREPLLAMCAKHREQVLQAAEIAVAKSWNDLSFQQINTARGSAG